jgi:hypothetical protein
MMLTTLCDYAAREIAQLRQKGCAITDADVIEINALANDAANKGHYSERMARGRPVPCGGAWLWPLTLLASDWYDSIGCEIGDGRAALAYAMAHGRDEELLKAGKREVKAWARRLKCTPAELDVAIHEVLKQSDDPDLTLPGDEEKAGPRMTAGSLSALMVARCGGTVEQWERMVSVGYIRDVLETLTDQDAATGEGVLDYRTRQAERALDACIRRIEERCKNG